MSFGGGSSGGGSVQTTVNPYAPAQPALNQILSEAGTLYNQGVQGSGYVAPTTQTTLPFKKVILSGYPGRLLIKSSVVPFLSPLIADVASSAYTNCC